MQSLLQCASLSTAGFGCWTRNSVGLTGTMDRYQVTFMDRYQAINPTDRNGGRGQETRRAPPRTGTQKPTALLPPGGPRSEHDPERAVAADTITMHPVTMHPLTGTFTDAYHEQAFAAQLFRLAFPVHALILTLACLWTCLSSPTASQWAAWLTALLTLVLR